MTKIKNIKQFKQGKITESKRAILLKKQQLLLDELVKVNGELWHGSQISLEEALRRTYELIPKRVGGMNCGCRLTLPKCLMGKRVKLKLVENTK